MWYPFVDAKIAADRLLDSSLSELGYELDLSHNVCFGSTGMTYSIKGIGVIGISALDPDSDLFAVLACYEHELEKWLRSDVSRSTRFRAVLVGRKPNPYPPTVPQDEDFLADLYTNPHAINQLRGVGSYCSLNVNKEYHAVT
jgi:hypothetical protein